MELISQEFLKKVGEEILNHPELTKTIKSRGRSLFKKGAVINVDLSKDVLTAVVVGTKPYLVKVVLKDGRIEELYCSCPYDGYICKHIAALGFYLAQGHFKRKFEFYFVPKEVAERALIKPILASNPHYKVLKEILENLYTSDKIYKHIFDRLVSKLVEPFEDSGLYLLLVMLNNLDYSGINRENWNRFVDALFDTLKGAYFGENPELVDFLANLILEKTEPLLKEDLKDRLKNLEREFWDW